MLTAIMIGNKIAIARKNKNLSQAQLAEQLFISSQAVGKWERGESMPDILMFNRIAETLDVDLNYFSENFSSEAPAGKALPVTEKKPLKKSGWDMSRGNWVDADFSGLKNLHEKFSESNMQKCLFIGSDLSGIFLKSNYIEDCDLSDSDISGSRIQNSQISGSRLNNCSLNGTAFLNSYIKGCDLTEADFTGVHFKTSSLQSNELNGAVWNGTSFENSGFVDIAFEGEVKDCSFENCDFKSTTFRNVTLTNTFFKCKTLKKIRFENCRADRISYAFLKNGKADLSGIELTE